MKLYMNKEELANTKAIAMEVAKAHGAEKAMEHINEPVAEETRIGYLLIGDDLSVGVKEDAFCDIADAIFDICDGYGDRIQEAISGMIGIVRAFDPIGFYKKFFAK